MYENEVLPHYMTITSLSPDEIGWSCPKDLEPYDKAYRYKLKLQDEQMWQLGIYINNAVTVAVEHCLAGKKAKSKYLEKPLMDKVFEYEGLTQQEIDEIEIQKLIANEKKWQSASKQKGLKTYDFSEQNK